MKLRTALGFSLLVLATVGGIATFPMITGQPPTTPTETIPIKPVSHNVPATRDAARPPKPTHDVAQMPEAFRHAFLSARSGAEWLIRMDNSINGRFLPGWVPALNVPADQDSFLFQAGATYALARAARYYGDERYLMKARQATLSLLAETQLDPSDPACRYTTLPPVVVNRLAAAGALLLAIHELSEPAEELLVQGEQLAAFVRKQQQPDGSFRGTDGPDLASAEATGLALQGLTLSIRHRPAAWKLEVATKALAHCQQVWKTSPSSSVAAGFIPAFAEAFVRSRNKAFAEFVFEIGDWICDRQFAAETSNRRWAGGFRETEQGKPTLRAPGIASAGAVETLACACLVTRHMADATRYARYREAVGAGCQFLISLQFTEANTMHFSPAYRSALIGGFHASAQDGNLRLDHQHHALGAMLQRLSSVGDR